MTRRTRECWKITSVCEVSATWRQISRENYADDVVVLCELGAPRGRDAIRRSARHLGLQLPDAELQFPTKLVEGEHAFLVWKARSQRFEVDDGADSFVIRGGRILAQTIFYRLSKGSI